MSDNPYQATQLKELLSDGGKQGQQMDGVASMLRQTKPWVRFISVMMFIGSAFMVLGGIGLMIGTAFGGVGRTATFGMLGMIYLVMAMFYIVPAIFLWRYANRIALFVQMKSIGALESALESQKSFWKFVGIMMLVVMALYAGGIVVAVILTATNAMR